MCASVGMNGNGKVVTRPVQSLHSSRCKDLYEDENIIPLFFRNSHLCMGTSDMSPNKICDWRPGGAMLYCRREDGPWILAGVETLPESCSSDPKKGNMKY